MNSVNDILFGEFPKFPRYDLADKQRNYNYYMRYLLDRTQHIFKYEGLPETIPARELELLLQMCGHCSIAQWKDGNLYAVRGNWAGVPDPYYIPRDYVVANPVLGSRTMKIDDECIIMGNDSMYTGLYPLFGKYASMFVECDISMLMGLINSRIVSMIAADDDNTKQAAEKFLKDIIDGKLGAIANDTFLTENLKSIPYSSASGEKLTDLIELNQYLKASMFNDIGLNANYNMKRESINAAEAQMNNDALYPLIDDMLEFRKLKVEKINDMFGTDISVDLDGVWKIKDEADIEPEADETVEDVNKKDSEQNDS